MTAPSGQGDVKSAAPRSLTHRTMVGAGWMVLWRMVTRVLGVVSTLVLARILVPADYGVVAIATTYVAIFDALSEVGLQDAIVRTDRVDDALLDTAFTISALRGLMSGVVIACSAPWAADFFNEQKLVSVLLVLAFFPIIEAVENIGVVEFRRQLRFEREFQLFLVPRIVSVAVTIALAFLLRSYWAMVFGLAALRVARLALTYLMHPYRPRFSIAAWRRLISFSFWTWLTAIASLGRDRSWAFVLGRLFDTVSVGVFMMAWEIAVLPINEVVAPICRALYSGFSAARNEGTRLGDTFTRAITVVAVPILPAAIGISATASYIVSLGLGEKWTSATSLIQWIAAASPFAVLTAIGATVMTTTGHLKNNFLIVLAGAVGGTLLCYLMAKRLGVVGAAQSLAIVIIAEGLAFGMAAAFSLGASIRESASRLVRPAVATLVMALVLWESGYGWVPLSGSIGEGMIECCAAVLIGAGTYGATLLLLWSVSGRPAGAESFLLELLRNRLSTER